MENKQSPSKKLLCSKEEKLIDEVDYKEIVQKGSSHTHYQASQRVLISIKPRTPRIKTLYIAEKNRFCTKKNSNKTGSRLAVGDHSSITTHCIENDSKNNLKLITYETTKQPTEISESKCVKKSSKLGHIETFATVSELTDLENISSKVNNINSDEKCDINGRPQLIMNVTEVDSKTDKLQLNPHKVDISTIIVRNTSSEDSALISASAIKELNKRVDYLERKIMRQNLIFRSLNPNIPQTSSDEETKENFLRTNSQTDHPSCSYIEQYNHIPETSAFQRHTRQTAPISSKKAATLEKEHNSEQYSRDFTTYDGITSRVRRQSASMPHKRDDVSKIAAERVHKIRHKLNPVRDYRLMDTVHYLAQGEFAPRDDGIKLTPSREAVLSDIIWEDVCRTHWPNARLGRRVAHPERYNARGELQRLIDSLLRERVAHVERKRRRHYKIVKLNHRHDNCRPIGKTGDIIVASHKNKHNNNDKTNPFNDINAASDIMTNRRHVDHNIRRGHRSHNRLISPDFHDIHQSILDDGCPGPSYTAPRTRTNREATYCYHTSSPEKDSNPETKTSRFSKKQDVTSRSSTSCKPVIKSPRLVVRKDISRNIYQSKEEQNLAHYIVLPTLVVRTPSNVKRQKKFNELYQRILNVHLNKSQNVFLKSEEPEPKSNRNRNTKDIGFNINITLSDSSEKLRSK